MMHQPYANGHDDDRIRDELLRRIHEAEEKMIAHMFTYNRILDLHNAEAYRAFRDGRDGDALALAQQMERMIQAFNEAIPDDLPISQEQEPRALHDKFDPMWGNLITEILDGTEL